MPFNEDTHHEQQDGKTLILENIKQLRSMLQHTQTHIHCIHIDLNATKLHVHKQCTCTHIEWL